MSWFRARVFAVVLGALMLQDWVWCALGRPSVLGRMASDHNCAPWQMARSMLCVRAAPVLMHGLAFLLFGFALSWFAFGCSSPEPAIDRYTFSTPAQDDALAPEPPMSQPLARAVRLVPVPVDAGADVPDRADAPLPVDSGAYASDAGDWCNAMTWEHQGRTGVCTLKPGSDSECTCLH